jgi:hypothetical protein
VQVHVEIQQPQWSSFWALSFKLGDHSLLVDATIRRLTFLKLAIFVPSILVLSKMDDTFN